MRYVLSATSTMPITFGSEPDDGPHDSVTAVIGPEVSTTLACTSTPTPGVGTAGSVTRFAITGPAGGGGEPLWDPGLASVA